MRSIVDTHTHILPGIDDGSASVSESLELLRMEAEQGVRHILATPHFYPQQDKPHRFLKRREEAVEKLRSAMEGKGVKMDISVGAEVYYYPGISNSEELSQLTLGKSRYILIEMPFTAWTSRMYKDLEEIRAKQGLTPIVAHVDRYLGVFRTHGIPDALENLPVLVQANASFFTGRFTAKTALRMLSREQIHLLGSDCHNLKDRKPNLAGAVELIEKKLGESALSWLRYNEDRILTKMVKL